MPKHARRMLPAPHPGFVAHSPVVALSDDNLEPVHAAVGSSPAARMQLELYQRFNAERNPTVEPYPAPVRVAILVVAAAGSWGMFYAIARAALHAIY